jgi:hypothetical protein
MKPTLEVIEELKLRYDIIKTRKKILTDDMTKQVIRDEEELLDITYTFDEHPEDYDGPCLCQECRKYCGN